MRRSAINLLNPKTPSTITFGSNEPDDDLALVCQRCGAVVTQYDPTGGAWCDTPFCARRAALLWQGYCTDWPKVSAPGMGINAGEAGWIAFARRADDGRIRTMVELFHQQNGEATAVGATSCAGREVA